MAQPAGAGCPMTPSEAIAVDLEIERAAMRELLSALVAIPTENPPATGYAPCVALLESTLDRLGFPFERIEIPSPSEAPRVALRAWLGEHGPSRQPGSSSPASRATRSSAAAAPT
jgi:acetylornithine deacetylase/succinyl-diaminopimelate desuccinylase-like protein